MDTSSAKKIVKNKILFPCALCVVENSPGLNCQYSVRSQSAKDTCKNSSKSVKNLDTSKPTSSDKGDYQSELVQTVDSKKGIKGEGESVSTVHDSVEKNCQKVSNQTYENKHFEVAQTPSTIFYNSASVNNTLQQVNIIGYSESPGNKWHPSKDSDQNITLTALSDPNIPQPDIIDIGDIVEPLKTSSPLEYCCQTKATSADTSSPIKNSSATIVNNKTTNTGTLNKESLKITQNKATSDKSDFIVVIDGIQNPKNFQDSRAILREIKAYKQLEICISFIQRGIGDSHI